MKRENLERVEESAAPKEDVMTIDALAEAIEQNGPPSPCCGAGMCEHGVCDNYCNHDGEPCGQCLRELNLERDAEREAAFQRDVIGPMFGFTDDEKVGE